MFEDRCLMCGLHLADDTRAYCSDECENNDSPSISSSSSVLSSPKLGYVLGGEVPSLMPSALGSALRSYTAENHHSISSSSSTSSASWSLFTDEEDQEVNHPYSSSSEYSHHDAADALSDPNIKVHNLINSVNPSALSYARIPSGTNNQSLLPQVKPRSRSRHVRGFPRSAPIQSHVAPEDGTSSDADFSSEPLDSDSEVNSNIERGDRLVTAKMKRRRNRASLPACFSLLQTASPSKPIRSPPISSSSGHATVRQSPPTPRLPSKRPGSTLDITPTVVPLTALYDTPRGRRREAGHSSCGNRTGNSSRSNSRLRRRLRADDSPHPNNGSERLFDWSAEGFALPIRGRPSVRRNSSPLSRIISDAMNAEMQPTGRSQFGSASRPRPRGRTRVEDLDGIGSSVDAPGYGNGRSGLVNRERANPLRVPL